MPSQLRIDLSGRYARMEIAIEEMASADKLTPKRIEELSNEMGGLERELKGEFDKVQGEFFPLLEHSSRGLRVIQISIISVNIIVFGLALACGLLLREFVNSRLVEQGVRIREQETRMRVYDDLHGSVISGLSEIIEDARESLDKINEGDLAKVRGQLTRIESFAQEARNGCRTLLARMEDN